MTADFRALCAEMANELDHYYIGIQGHDRSHPLAVEARAAPSRQVLRSRR